MTLVIDIPGLRTQNELNASRAGWRPKHERRKAVRETVTYHLLAVDWTGLGKPTEDTPWDVLLVRLGPREMDDDGVVSALKSVRDAFAAYVGVDDKHRHIVRYRYEQAKSKTFGVRIEVTPRQLELKVGTI